jgi:hypothetical protein
MFHFGVKQLQKKETDILKCVKIVICLKGTKIISDGVPILRMHNFPVL